MGFMGIASTVAAAVGLLAGGGASGGPTEVPSSTGVTPSAFSVPVDNFHRWDRDHGRGWDGNRRSNDGWDGHPWRWWHDRGISAGLCQVGGGHVNARFHRCAGGRFDDFHIG